MATIEIHCPNEVAPGGEMNIHTIVSETLPFEFASCGNLMHVEYYIDDVLCKSEPLKPHIPRVFGDVADFWVTITAPYTSGVKKITAVLKGAGSLFPPGSCDGEARAECSVVVKEGAPSKANPIGEKPTNVIQAYLPYILVAGGIAVVVGMWMYYEEERREVMLMYLALSK